LEIRTPPVSSGGVLAVRKSCIALPQFGFDGEAPSNVSVDQRMSVTRITGDAAGAVLAEYALVLALLALVFIAGLEAVDGATASALSNLGTELMNYAMRNGA
jgi:Flp pilus assembly pilin Flp